MHKMITLLATILFSFLNLNASDLVQILNDENPEYKISITHGSNFIGDIEIQLFPDVAPEHCRNFDSLVNIEFYNKTAFHRVIPGFMIQGGDPNSRDKPKNTWGYGDPSQRKVPAEFSNLKHLRGSLSAARSSDINSATSQFFICVVPCPQLDGKYSIYGEVIDGMDIVDYIVNVARDQYDNPIEKVEMIITKLETSYVMDHTNTSDLINIYPNPANSYINIRTDKQTPSKYVLLNILGEQVLSGSIDQNDFRIDISYLPIGVYLLNLNGVTFRILKSD